MQMGQRMRIAFILLLASALVSRADENAAGRWEGTVKIPSRELVLVVDLAAGSGDGGGWQGSITVPELGIKGAPLTDIGVKSNEIVFSIKSALADQRAGPAKFNGHFVGEGELTGDFLQAGNSAPFALEKAGPPQVEPPPRSTAIAKEIEGEWKGGYELFGYPTQGHNQTAEPRGGRSHRRVRHRGPEGKQIAGRPRRARRRIPHH